MSKRLEQERENGRIYHAHLGKPIALPDSAADRPDPTLLRWHDEQVFERATAP